MPSILIVEDDVALSTMIATVLKAAGYTTLIAANGHEGLDHFNTYEFDVVVTDICMSPMDGLALLRQLRACDPAVVVVVMTGYATMETAVEALRCGAFDYLEKPFKVHSLTDTLRRALEFKKFLAGRPQQNVAAEADALNIESRIIGKSAAMTKLIAHMKKLTAQRTPVLLIGERGTGKRFIAQTLHLASGATEATFVSVDCAYSSDARFREGLLGFEGRGGAWVRQAEGGTLLLENLECLPGPTQKELTSVLRSASHGFRLICTTSEDIEKLVEEERFFAELFYRVGALPLHLPPLRERPEDIPLLIKDALTRVANPFFDANMIEFTPEAMAALKAYHWPGNLTEFLQMTSKLVATTETRLITLAQLPPRAPTLQPIEATAKARVNPSAQPPPPLPTPPPSAVSEEERLALEKLRASLEAQKIAVTEAHAALESQKAAVSEAHAALKQRETFVEESEATLMSKVFAQQEQEIMLEQRFEDLRRAEQDLRKRLALVDPAVAAEIEADRIRKRDEFNE